MALYLGSKEGNRKGVSYPSPSWGGWRIVREANDVTGGGLLQQKDFSRTAVH
jgi:hypothetical protein